ncbi:MAG: NADH-quinone oxidoreductase subunit J [Deltaproteobacteria bacterium]|nr:NADH-quinone oxidoreductase subunit J [Deltaproteobacteria bacterium]
MPMISTKSRAARGPLAPSAWALLAWVGAMMAPALALAAPAVQVTAASKGPTGAQIAFYIFAGISLFGAVMTITRRNPVKAALFLVLTLISTAGLYLALHATFLAAMQVLVYAGAIMVLFLFFVMSVGQPETHKVDLFRGWPVKVVGLAAIGALLWRVAMVFGDAKLFAAPVKVAATYGDVTSMGKLLFTKYLFPFEAISVLLLVAIVGSVMISRRAVSPPSQDMSTAKEPPADGIGGAR